MNELVIGADGFIGQRVQQLAQCNGTSRRNPLLLPNSYYLDLGDFKDSDLPEAEIVYLCAGVNGMKSCEGSKESFRINVDATIKVCEFYKEAFVVWISSQSIEWSSSAYSRQKSLAETVLRTLPNVGIVRAGRVTKDNLDDLCKTLIKVGRSKTKGLTLWGTDDISYAK